MQRDQKFILMQWASAEILSGEATLTFYLSFPDCWWCHANGSSHNPLPFLHHKENTPCYGNSQKCILLAAISWGIIVYDNFTQ